MQNIPKNVRQNVCRFSENTSSHGGQCLLCIGHAALMSVFIVLQHTQNHGHNLVTSHSIDAFAEYDSKPMLMTLMK